jgi:hypothetical protein
MPQSIIMIVVLTLEQSIKQGFKPINQLAPRAVFVPYHAHHRILAGVSFTKDRPRQIL